MFVRVDKARVRKTERYFLLTVLADDGVTELGTEELHYGLDVPIPTIRREFLTIVHNKYESPQEEILPIEGEVIPLP